MPRAPKSVLVAFSARDGDPYKRDNATGRFLNPDVADRSSWGPVLRIVALPSSPLCGSVSDIYYLCHPVTPIDRRRTVGRTSREVAADLQEALDLHLPDAARPTLHVRTWRTSKPPIDHADLFEFVQRELRTIRMRHHEAELVLQVSSGTDAMRSVLLLAGLVGVIPGPVRLIQAERNEGALARPHQTYAEIDLRLATVLRLAQGAAPATPGSDQASTLSYEQATSPALRQALDAIMRAARAPFPLLLRGERGVGKSTMAQLVRSGGPFRQAKRDRSWPAIACGQFADAARLTVELFGARRGAYTDLREDRVGLIEHADGDTLFLDEVHDLDNASQRALIRVLEDGIYYRLGDAEPRHSAFRLISGTNQSDDVLRQRLAPDFLDRIRDLEVWIPPLRDCRDDHAWMWRAAAANVATKSGVSVDLLTEHSKEILASLARHPLPGNWRDLRRLAVRLASEALTSRGLSQKTLRNLLEQCLALPPGGQQSTHEADPILRNGHERKYYRQLEQALGRHLSRFWERVEAGQEHGAALWELLQDRDRVRRAQLFLRRSHPRRFRGY